jgi:hypothetical protein
MLLCCINEDRWEGLDEKERDSVMQEYGAWMRKLDASGNHVLSARLQPSATAATVRGHRSKPSVVDGPFAETKEQIGGFHLINAADLEEAVAVAERIPTLRVGGTIEVRPLRPESL